MASEQLRQELHDVIPAVLARHEECSVLHKWVLLAETSDLATGRGVWILTNPDAKTWDALGLLLYAIQAEQASANTAASGDT